MKYQLHLLMMVICMLSLVEAQLLPALSPVPSPDRTFCPCQKHPSTRPPRPFYRRSPSQVHFLLYTRSNRQGFPDKIILGNSTSLSRSHFKSSRPVKFLIHGHRENRNNTPYMEALKDALLMKANVNVIQVFWPKLADKTYVFAAKNSIYVGKVVAGFLYFIKENTINFSGKQVHLIGFSMGAQVAGVAGYHYRGIGRITGLDPAGASYECVAKKNRLDSSDADFVDVIHTNGGCRITGHLGTQDRSGHLDVYVNGGSHQHGCDHIIVNLAVDLLLPPADNYRNSPPMPNRADRWFICSHHRAPYLYAETITASEASNGFLCNNYSSFKSGACFNNPRIVFGYHTSKPFFNGTYFMETQSESPYLARHVKIEVILSKATIPIFIGRLKIQVLLPGRKTPVVAVFSHSRILVPGKIYSTIVTVPTGTSLDEAEILLEPEKTLLLTFCPSSFKVKKISATDVHSHTEYCLASDISLKVDKSYKVKPTKGSCQS